MSLKLTQEEGFKEPILTKVGGFWEARQKLRSSSMFGLGASTSAYEVQVYSTRKEF